MQVRLRKRGFRNAGTEILAAKLGDDVVEVVFRAEALPFEHFHNGSNLPHITDGRLFEGHGFAFGTIAHRVVASSCAAMMCQEQE